MFHILFGHFFCLALNHEDSFEKLYHVEPMKMPKWTEFYTLLHCIKQTSLHPNIHFHLVFPYWLYYFLNWILFLCSFKDSILSLTEHADKQVMHKELFHVLDLVTCWSCLVESSSQALIACVSALRRERIDKPFGNLTAKYKSSSLPFIPLSGVGYKMKKK